MKKVKKFWACIHSDKTKGYKSKNQKVKITECLCNPNAKYNCMFKLLFYNYLLAICSEKNR